MTNSLLRPAAAWLVWLGKRRDGFLVLGAIAYGLGYLVWAFYAWNNQLGLLPVLQSQYLVAGLFISLGIGAVYLVVQGSRWAKKRMGELESKWAQLFFGAWFASALGFIAIYFVLELEAPRWTAYVSIIVFALLSYIVKVRELDLASQPNEWRKAASSVYNLISSWLGILGQLYFWFFLSIFPALALYSFVETYFARIPQELGGAKPRCAYLDVDSGRLSASTQAALSPGVVLDGKETIRRTGQVSILYSGDRSVMVRPGDAISPPIEIDRETITAIHACAP